MTPYVVKPFCQHWSSHYLNQCGDIYDQTLSNKLQLREISIKTWTISFKKMYKYSEMLPGKWEPLSLCLNVLNSLYWNWQFWATWKFALLFIFNECGLCDFFINRKMIYLLMHLFTFLSDSTLSSPAVQELSAIYHHPCHFKSRELLLDCLHHPNKFTSQLLTL